MGKWQPMRTLNGLRTFNLDWLLSKTYWQAAQIWHPYLLLKNSYCLFTSVSLRLLLQKVTFSNFAFKLVVRGQLIFHHSRKFRRYQSFEWISCSLIKFSWWLRIIIPLVTRNRNVKASSTSFHSHSMELWWSSNMLHPRNSSTLLQYLTHRGSALVLVAQLGDQFLWWYCEEPNWNNGGSRKRGLAALMRKRGRKETIQMCIS